MKQPVTGLVLTFNGERLLADCLRSLDFCDRILVVDSKSTDATVEVAREHGAEVLLRTWEGPVPQFRFAFERIGSGWVVSLDQDEAMDDTLRDATIRALDGMPSNGPDGFMCSRSSYYLDRFMRHSGWYPDRLLRVFRFDTTEIHHSGPHYGFRSRGRVESLPGHIVHYPYRDLTEHIDKINYYTLKAAEEMHRQGRKAGLVKAVGHGLGYFLKYYVLKRGFLDGRAGFLLAVNSMYYGFLKYAHLMDIRARQDIEKPST
ncbi:MAG: glycosyltransferase family 2 protein [Deltaproteobacteria bacterium]|nr:glycosyltransferase family 2 protein [Deltaproteobacteria bacterium]